MLVWFVATAWWGVWVVLKDPRFDYRLLAVGALAPDAVELVSGSTGSAHSVVASIALLTAVMLATFGRRPIRRRMLALPFGTLIHLIADGAFNDTTVFWWPLAGVRPDPWRLPSLDRGTMSLVLEVAGVLLLVAWYRRFGWASATRRARFMRTGELDPAIVSGTQVPTC